LFPVNPEYVHVGIGEAQCRGIAHRSVPERAAHLLGSCTMTVGIASGAGVWSRVPVSNLASM
jgi:hypothetical protein